jgi:hypothetical protein
MLINQLSEEDRLKLTVVALRVQLANERLLREQDNQRLVQATVGAGYNLGDGDTVNLDTGAISRAEPLTS